MKNIRKLRIGIALFALASVLSALFINTTGTNIVRGNIDGFTVIGGQPFLQGWACDTKINRSITVHMYVGGRAGQGTYAGVFPAMAYSEAAVSSACGTAGTPHRFYIPITAALIQKYAGKSIHIHGISQLGPNYEIGRSGQYQVPTSTNMIVDGNIDGIFFSHKKSATAGTVDRILYGWACDTKTSKAIKVHVYVGAPAGRRGASYLKSANANMDKNNAGVASRCGFNNGAHYFEVTLTEAEVNAHAGKAIYIHGISQNPSGLNGLIGRSGQFAMPQARKTVSKVADIQPALDLAYANGGGVVSVKNGTYHLTRHLNIQSNTALISESKVRYIRKSSGNMLRNQLNTAQGYNGYGNIAIIGGTWDGNPVEFPQSHATMALGYATHLLVRGVTILDVTGGGHAIDLSSSREVLIEDSNFFGLVFSGANGEEIKEAIQLDHNIPHNPMSVASFAFGARDGNPNINVTIRNNNFGGNPNSPDRNSQPWPVGVGGHGAVHNKYMNNILIENNTFNDCSFAGVRPYKWNNVIIRKNTFNRGGSAVRTTPAVWNTSAARSADRSIDYGVSQAGTGLEISNNKINAPLGVPLVVLGAFKDGSANAPIVYWKKITVKDNVVKSVPVQGSTFEKVESLTATNNTYTLNDPAIWAFRFYSSKNSSAKNNKFTGGRNAGVYIPAGNTNVTASGNTWKP